VRRIVLTGGHGVGKSSLISTLEVQGECVIHEAAATIRRLGQANGDPFPEDAPDFESRALALHMLRESRVPASAERVFLDRGAPDHLAYARCGRWSLSEPETRTCQEARYDAAFLVEPPEGGVPTLGRPEAAFCARLVGIIEGVYAELGIPVIRLPHMPVDDRVALILRAVRAAPGEHELATGAKPT
jgi:predicted ATPase